MKPQNLVVLQLLCVRMSRATVLLPRCRVLLYHPDSMQNTTVAVPKLSVLSTPTLLPKMEMGGKELLENKRRMDPRLWIMKWNMKEPMAESKKLKWDSLVVPGKHKNEL